MHAILQAHIVCAHLRPSARPYGQLQRGKEGKTNESRWYKPQGRLTVYGVKLTLTGLLYTCGALFLLASKTNNLAGTPLQLLEGEKQPTGAHNWLRRRERHLRPN